MHALRDPRLREILEQVSGGQLWSAGQQVARHSSRRCSGPMHIEQASRGLRHDCTPSSPMRVPGSRAALVL